VRGKEWPQGRFFETFQQNVNIFCPFWEEFTTVKRMAHPLLDAIGPVADAIGATVLGPEGGGPGDVPLVWEGQVVGFVRLSPADVASYIAAVERELGGSLGSLSRLDKQRAVTILNERGAFGLRKSVEQVAEALGVSRFTVYNYLNRPKHADLPVSPLGE